MSKARAKMSMAAAAKKREKTVRPINLKTLARVFLLDGTSKLLQMDADSNVEDIVLQMKFNLNLQDISTFAIFTVSSSNDLKRLNLDQKVTEVVNSLDEKGKEYKLLFKSWIYARSGVFETLALQPSKYAKEATGENWLMFMEALHEVSSGNLMLTEEESILLGCLKLQSDSGDYRPDVHTIAVIKQRVIGTFPEPVSSILDEMEETKGTILKKANPEYAHLLDRIVRVYQRVSGKSKIECHVEYINTLRMWSPYFGASRYKVRCQYDDKPSDKTSNPPILDKDAIISPLAIFLRDPEKEEEGVVIDDKNIVRHAYNRVVRWVTRSKPSLFAYWVVKLAYELSDISDVLAKFTAGNYEDINDYTDCVYFMSDSAGEIEHLVKSYVALSNRGVFPCLPNASFDLMHPIPEEEDKTQATPTKTDEGAASPNNSTSALGNSSTFTAPIASAGKGGWGLIKSAAQTKTLSAKIEQSTASEIDNQTPPDAATASDVTPTTSSPTTQKKGGASMWNSLIGSTVVTSTAAPSTPTKRGSVWGSLLATVSDTAASESKPRSVSTSAMSTQSSATQNNDNDNSNSSSSNSNNSNSSNNNTATSTASTTAHTVPVQQTAVLAAIAEMESKGVEHFDHDDEDDDSDDSDAGAGSDDSSAGAGDGDDSD